MGEVDDARNAEDDRQAGRDQKQRRRAGKTGQELDDVEGHVRFSARARFSVVASSFETALSRLLRMRAQLHLAPLAGRGRIALAIRVRGYRSINSHRAR